MDLRDTTNHGYVDGAGDSTADGKEQRIAASMSHQLQVEAEVRYV